MIRWHKTLHPIFRVILAQQLKNLLRVKYPVLVTVEYHMPAIFCSLAIYHSSVYSLSCCLHCNSILKHHWKLMLHSEFRNHWTNSRKRNPQKGAKYEGSICKFMTAISPLLFLPLHLPSPMGRACLSDHMCL